MVAAGYEVFAINPMSTSRFRQRHCTSRAKSDPGDAHVLAEIVRLDRDHHRPIAGDSDAGEAMKLVARSHQTMIWDRTRHVLRLRSALREYFAAALDAFDDLDARTRWRFWPQRRIQTAPRLSKSKIAAALRLANRRDVDDRATQIQQVFLAPGLRRAVAIQTAFPAITVAETRLITALNDQVDTLGEVSFIHFGRHPDAKVYASQPGLGTVLGARVLSEFGDDPKRYASAKARKNYAGTAPITRASGTKKTVLARHARNDRLSDAVHQWALGSLRGSPGARAYYDAMRTRGIGHHAALRQLGNRLVGILHGCLKTRTLYDENTAWAHQTSHTA